MFLEEIYEKQSRVPNETWLKAVCGKSSWILNAEKLREKTFQAVGKEYGKFDEDEDAGPVLTAE